MTREEILNQLYNLILSRHIREWEREKFYLAKSQIESGVPLKRVLGDLEFLLRPQALRATLTPEATHFYEAMTHSTKFFSPGTGKNIPRDH